MHNKEILSLIAEKYPKGFPETEEGLKCLTEDEVLGIFRLAFVLGKWSVKA